MERDIMQFPDEKLEFNWFYLKFCFITNLIS